MIGNSNTTRKASDSSAGFTLVEVLIATMIISIVMVLASNLLLLFFRSQDTSRNTLYLEAEVRQIVSRIVETARTSYIDYDFYAAAPTAQPDLLAFRTSDGLGTVYWFYSNGSQTNVFVCANKAIDEECDTSANPEIGGDWARMNDTQTDLLLGMVNITPDTAPYLTDATPSDQAPLIIMSLQMELSSGAAQTPVIQTTITPRIYAR